MSSRPTTSRPRRGVVLPSGKKLSSSRERLAKPSKMADTESAPRLVELPPDNDEPPEITIPASEPFSQIPFLYTSYPILRDDLITESSQLQDQTTEEVLPFLNGSKNVGAELNSFGIPKLRRAKHIKYLYAAVDQLPEWYVSLDASRPWLVYWAMNGLSLLGVDFDDFKNAHMKER